MKDLRNLDYHGKGFAASKEIDVGILYPAIGSVVLFTFEGAIMLWLLLNQNK